MSEIKEKGSHLYRLKVTGSNWTNYAEINVKDYPSIEDAFIECGTIAVEEFLRGNYSAIDPEKPVGFAAVIVVEDEDNKMAYSIRSDIILANCSRHTESAELKKVIEARKKNPPK